MPAPGAVLVKADYSGKIVDGVGEFDAVFSAYCFTDETIALTVPLDGVQLTGDVLLDGSAVQAAALPAPQAGFTIPVKGRSKSGEPPHRLELHFRTPVTGTTHERNIQFTAPRLAQSHLLLRLPKGSAYIQALVKYGVQKRADDGDPYSLDVELGRIAAPLHLRWVPGGSERRISAPAGSTAARSVSLGSSFAIQQPDGFSVLHHFPGRDAFAEREGAGGPGRANGRGAALSRFHSASTA